MGTKKRQTKFYKTSINLKDKTLWEDFVKFCKDEGLIASKVVEKMLMKFLKERGVK
ncbi:hypothetical protein NAMH_1506 [Nautilia profundicola AmH]|uniref:Uncharacterized protein n=1 Tax=Nautilia profundicola (strain ATCC BAA-1463 / DSM 18972 / AmH) TaxID=598659 RepID=B9L6A8_NAUPA|nr:hypothetical protein [Nautilia profundicola]ACM92245.1 hypothetical protein NAMH_1506 [Nautilia profundicola AmH]